MEKTSQPPLSTVIAYARLMRLDRPVGTLLLLWPTLAALWMAADALPPIDLIVVFAIGTILMRAAGCVVNDYADRDFDPGVERTADRPLATGTVSTNAALGAFFVLAFLALTLLLYLNTLTRWLAVAGLGIAVAYPFMKRWTYLPQVVLGAAFSWGIVMAFAAVQNKVPEPAWLLFLASVLWIVAYDTMYAMVDREDDLRVGIKSTAILFGEADRPMIALLQAGTVITLVLVGQRLGYQGYYFWSIAAVTGLLCYQQYLIRDRSREGCFRAFANNVWVGFTLFVGVVLETMTRGAIQPVGG
ncbi:MAG: 4-hydroxybenzoate octaprenyltransferase [Pseudomonadales bacterium]|nr:4-hydroxybenzoate octaprenyltransferase [Pseudomonadales bacterium]NIX07634.1 4-hydroxybenzoate octaprenyltransferase [Pseudomonadales bacterium]